VAIFEPRGAPIDVFPKFFVLVLLLVIVLEEALSITSTSTIRLGGLSTSRRESQNSATSKG
jgi:hypothetical protein